MTAALFGASPSIATIEPGTVTVAALAQPITVNGANLPLSVGAISFVDRFGAPHQVQQVLQASPTRLIVMVVLDVPGNWTLTITNPGSGSSSKTFVVGCDDVNTIVPPCGVAFASVGYAGQQAKSNGCNQLKGGQSCANVDPAAPYGHRYQCVEYASRVVYAQIGEIAINHDPQVEWNIPAPSLIKCFAFDGVIDTRTGCRAPRAGDFLIWQRELGDPPDTYHGPGHVAVISSVQTSGDVPTQFALSEQNWSHTGTLTLNVSNQGGTLTIERRPNAVSYTLLGWLRLPQVQIKPNTGTGSGVVVSTPAGVNCGSTCLGTFSKADPLRLEAQASDGSQFTGWAGDCASAGSSNVVTLTLTDDMSCTPKFDLNPDQTPGLHINPSGQIFTAGPYALQLNDENGHEIHVQQPLSITLHRDVISGCSGTLFSSDRSLTIQTGNSNVGFDFNAGHDPACFAVAIATKYTITAASYADGTPYDLTKWPAAQLTLRVTR